MRLSQSNADMWEEIFDTNSTEIDCLVEKFLKNFGKRLIDRKNSYQQFLRFENDFKLKFVILYFRHLQKDKTAESVKHDIIHVKILAF